MNEWNHDAKRLLEGGRDAFTPEPDRRDRVRAKLAATLGAAAFSTAVATTATTATTPGLPVGRSLFAKFAVPIGLAAFVLAAAALLWPKAAPQAGRAGPATSTTQGPPSSSPSAHVVVPHTPEVALAASAPAEPASVAAASVAASAPPVRTKAPPAAAALPATSASGEIPLVAAMDGALRARELSEAERLIAEHARRYPKGQLVEERLAAEVIVSCLRAAPSALARTQAFLRTYPKSPHRSRILDACPAATEPRP